jgi:presenilin-like A22 family membrane protease
MKVKISSAFWASLLMVLALALTFFVASEIKLFLEANLIASPDVSFAWATGYFIAVVAVMALILSVIPLSKLRLVLKMLFALMFAWGTFVAIALILPEPAAVSIAVAAGVAWLLWARVWLHNFILLVTLSSAGSVFGFLFQPLTFMIFMLVIAVYDMLAVRFGFMVWMADRLSEVNALPAFIKKSH